MDKRLFRHGDLLLRDIGKIPAGFVPVKGGILAEGEVTGHKHALVGGCVQLYKKGEDLAFVVGQETELRHEEVGMSRWSTYTITAKIDCSLMRFVSKSSETFELN